MPTLASGRNKPGPGSEEKHFHYNPNMFYKSLYRHTPQSSKMGFHANWTSFPHRETAWWRTRHTQQLEAMHKDLRELVDRPQAPENQN